MAALGQGYEARWRRHDNGPDHASGQSTLLATGPSLLNNLNSDIPKMDGRLASESCRFLYTSRLCGVYVRLQRLVAGMVAGLLREKHVVLRIRMRSSTQRRLVVGAINRGPSAWAYGQRRACYEFQCNSYPPGAHTAQRNESETPHVKMTRTHIERMLRFRAYKVRLSCGHSFECSEEDVDRDHLFIGKSVQCGKCLDREIEEERKEPD